MPDQTIRLFDTQTQTGYDVLLRANGDGTYSPVTSAFGNYEEIVLPSAQDTTGGRTSADLVNNNARMLAFLIEVTEVNGTGVLDEVGIDAKVGGGWVELIAYAANISVASRRVFYVGQGASSLAPVGFDTIVPRNFRVRANSTTDGAGNNITYSVTVCYLS